MTAFNQGRDKTRALPPFTFGGENTDQPWVLATKYEKDNFLTRANLRTKIKNKELWAFRHKNRIYVKECPQCLDCLELERAKFGCKDDPNDRSWNTP
ncbi:hypothetical protein AWQ24_14725 (plasmid) [Picosynechococcus sp. PCC 8807]|nr:hypothetical protein AWQ24_14725 [Picosynechococcus sp. PCC 8807]